jgi:two-component system, cell cycle sensor histidine kinase and response regulator CckA
MADPTGIVKNVFLVVDDQPEIRRVATVALSRAGFSAQVAEDGQEGLECFLRHRQDVCLVVSDVVMPLMNGLEMIDRILEIEPNTPILMMSAYSSAVLELQARDKFTFIRKPFLIEDFVHKVREVLERPSSATA